MDMSITPKVVPIADKKSSLVARDTKTHRTIIAIGGERLALDFSTRITKLAARTGDQPAGVLPINPGAPEKRKSARSKKNTITSQDH